MMFLFEYVLRNLRSVFILLGVFPYNPQLQKHPNLPEANSIVIVIIREEEYIKIKLAEQINITQSTISRVLTRFVVTGSNSRRPGQGHTRVKTLDPHLFLISYQYFLQKEFL